MPDDAQPPEGQGETGASPYDSYLQSVPSEARDAAEQWFRDTSKGLDAKLQEAAEIRKNWEPYENVRGTLTQYDPEQLSQLLAWHQEVTSSDEAFQNWLQTTAQEAGLTPAQEQGLEEAEESGELTRGEIQQLIQEQAEQRLAPLQEQMQQLEMERAVDHESDTIRSSLDALQAEHKVQLTEAQKAIVLDLGMNDEGEDWVQKGFERFREIQTEGQRAFVEGKSAQPQSAITTGGVEKFKPATTFPEARDQALEVLRRANQG